MNEELENKNMCSKCGGYCCKKCGCDYFATDFPQVNTKSIEKVLREGRTSIVALLTFGYAKNGKITIEPLLYLRARNKDRGEIDLLSFKTRCASLEENGCYYDFEHRPSAGTLLVPFFVNGQRQCYSIANNEEQIEQWKQYQKVLGEVVKRHTGMGVYAKLRVDVEKLFDDIVMKRFDGVAKAELIDVINMLPMLAEAYPDEFKKAKEKVSKAPLTKSIFRQN